MQIRRIGIFAALALLMAATRYNHFGTAATLADASLAVFFMAGFYFSRVNRAALLAFVLLLLEAGVIDYYATSYQGVSDWCMSPAYWFLIPTYASLWLGGRWFAAQQRNDWVSLAKLAGVAWASTSVAFLISNASFYLVSGKFDGMGAGDYAVSVAQYYPSYLGSCLIYLVPVATFYLVRILLHKPVAGAMRG
jgi:hypothetical protein